MVLVEVDIVNMLTNFGLAGVVIAMFYILLTRNLDRLTEAIKELNRNIQEMQKTLYAIQVLIDDNERGKRK